MKKRKAAQVIQEGFDTQHALTEAWRDAGEANPKRLLLGFSEQQEAAQRAADEQRMGEVRNISGPMQLRKIDPKATPAENLRREAKLAAFTIQAFQEADERM